MSATRLTRRVRLWNKDRLNLHAAALVSQLARRYPCDIRITCGDRQANAKSIWELMGLAAEPGCELILEAAGLQSKEALDCLEGLAVDPFRISAKEDCHEDF